MFVLKSRIEVKDLDRDVLSQGLDLLRSMKLLAYLKVG
jgi:aryl carrier-like protein